MRQERQDLLMAFLRILAKEQRTDEGLVEHGSDVTENLPRCHGEALRFCGWSTCWACPRYDSDSNYLPEHGPGHGRNLESVESCYR